MLNDFATPPVRLAAIQRDTRAAGFTMASEPLMGSLLRSLAAAKPRGTFLEIGTGTGVGTCWIADGMDAESRLVTVERDEALIAIAQRHLEDDARINFVCADAENFLKGHSRRRYDLIFADTFPGKFYLLNEALGLLEAGGLYVIDDLFPQPTWPENHQSNVDALLNQLGGRPDLHVTRLAWATGVVIATKSNHAAQG